MQGPYFYGSFVVTGVMQPVSVVFWVFWVRTVWVIFSHETIHLIYHRTCNGSQMFNRGCDWKFINYIGLYKHSINKAFTSIELPLLHHPYSSYYIFSSCNITKSHRFPFTCNNQIDISCSFVSIHPFIFTIISILFIGVEYFINLLYYYILFTKYVCDFDFSINIKYNTKNWYNHI